MEQYKPVVVEYNDIRVLTTKQIAEAYETSSEIISNNFARNKKRYQSEKHFICLEGEDLRQFKANHQNDVLQNTNKFYLWTEKGALLHAKSLNTDKAWEVYDQLVDTYFNRKKPLSALDQLKLTQSAVLEVKDQIDSVDKDLQEFKRDMPLLALECQKITRAKNQKVVPLLGGKSAPAYKDKSLTNRVYRDLESQIKREFGVDTYKAIKRSQCSHAIEIINRYELPLVLQDEIKNVNSQMAFA